MKSVRDPPAEAMAGPKGSAVAAKVTHSGTVMPPHRVTLDKLVHHSH